MSRAVRTWLGHLLRWDPLASFAGVLGLVSLLFTWYYWPPPWILGADTLLQVDITIAIEEPNHSGLEVLESDSLGLGLGVFIFTIGCLVALISRIGFVPQLAGLLVFVTDFKAVLEGRNWGADVEMNAALGLGYGIALVAALLCASATVAPTWMRSSRRRVPVTSRVMAFSSDSTIADR